MSTSLDSEIAVISGVDSNGRVATQSYATWRDAQRYPTVPAAYAHTADLFKWGEAQIGTGATITYWFDTASSWSRDERAAFVGAMALWSAVANVVIVSGPSSAAADFQIIREPGSKAADWNNLGFAHPAVGATELPVLSASPDNRIRIDTNPVAQEGFGPLSTEFAPAYSYLQSTLIHELGHMLGLGHGGPYDHTKIPGTDIYVDPLAQQYGPYDMKLWTLMSYVQPGDTAAWSASYSVEGTNWAGLQPQTPMMLDILAVQRIYGLPASSPLNGDNHHFGFNANITGDISRYYDFSINQHPVVTIWAAGNNNTLDLSGFDKDATINLNPGSFSSADGMVNNIGIAYFTVVNKGIGGSGNDTMYASDVATWLDGGGGSDVLWGGTGNDTLVGGAAPDTFHPGGGLNVLRDTLADMDGDTVFNFGQSTTIDVIGVLIGRNNLSVVHSVGDTTLAMGDTEILLKGGFAGGDFMSVARGAGAFAHTAVTFEPYLPNLFEGVRVAERSINGVPNELFMTGDGSIRFTVKLEAAISTFSNTLGYYEVAADGTIGSVHVLFGNTHLPGSTTVDLGTPGNGERIGFFLIQDGANLFANLPDNLSFVATGGGAANLKGGVPVVLHSATLGDFNGAAIFHTFNQLNTDHAYQVLSGVAPGGKDLQIGFEDVSRATGDNDYQDVVIAIHTNADGLFLI
jgi:serralysin